MVGDRDERRGSIGTLETNWMGAGGERMGRRGRKKIVAPAPAEEGRTQVLHTESQNCGADGREKPNQLRYGSKRTYQHSNFMDCGVIRRTRGQGGKKGQCERARQQCHG